MRRPILSAKRSVVRGGSFHRAPSTTFNFKNIRAQASPGRRTVVVDLSAFEDEEANMDWRDDDVRHQSVLGEELNRRRILLGAHHSSRPPQWRQEPPRLSRPRYRVWREI